MRNYSIDIEVDISSSSGVPKGFVIKGKLLSQGPKYIPFATMKIIKLDKSSAAPVQLTVTDPSDIQDTACTINEGDCVKDGADSSELIRLKIFRPYACGRSWDGNSWEATHNTDPKLKVISQKICDAVKDDQTHQIVPHHTWRWNKKPKSIPCTNYHKQHQIITGVTTSQNKLIPLDMPIDKLMYDCGWIEFYSSTDPNKSITMARGIINTPGSDLDPHVGGSPHDYWPKPISPSTSSTTVFKEGFLKYIGFGDGSEKNKMTFTWRANKKPHWTFELKYNNYPGPNNANAAATWLSDIILTNKVTNNDFSTYFSGNTTKAKTINGMSWNLADNITKTKYVLAKEWGDTLQWVFYLLYRICNPGINCTLSTCDKIVQLQILKYRDPVLPLLFHH